MENNQKTKMIPNKAKESSMKSGGQLQQKSSVSRVKNTISKFLFNIPQNMANDYDVQMMARKRKEQKRQYMQNMAMWVQEYLHAADATDEDARIETARLIEEQEALRDMGFELDTRRPTTKAKKGQFTLIKIKVRHFFAKLREKAQRKAIKYRDPDFE